MFEKHHEPVAPFSTFLFRLFYTATGGLLLITLIILLGMVCFHIYENMHWLDAFNNSAMTLADMGLSIQPESRAGKIFASFYALFCQFAFLSIFALIFSPVIHRLYHQFHSNHVTHAQNKVHSPTKDNILT